MLLAFAIPGAASAAKPKVTMAKHHDGPYQSTAPRVNLAGGEATSV